MEKDVKVVQEYIVILKRYKIYMLAIIMIGLILSATFALKSPAIYKSTATILIEQQEMPEDIVRSIVSNYAEQRIQIINKKIMSSKNLTKIITKFNLYQEEREGTSIHSIVDAMRENITMEIIGGEQVIDPRTGKATQPTLAFSLSFESTSPRIAQEVAQELVSLYLNENINQRMRVVEGATKFLTQETDKLREEVSVLEKALAKFKEMNASNLPEMNQLNLNRMERIEQQIVELDSQIGTTRETESYLRSELEQLAPDPTSLGRERLAALLSDYSNLSSKYSKRHPDVKKLWRQIENLRKDVDQGSLQLDSETTRSPAYIQLKGRLVSTQADLRDMRSSREALKNKLLVYEERIAKAPQIEGAYESLKRDYDNARVKYAEIRARKREVSMAQSMERNKKNDEFTLLEPPLFPETHFKPNRPAIMFLGLLASIAIAFGFVLVKESLKPIIYTSNRLTSVAGMPPLVSIPYVQLEQNPINKQTKLAFIIGGLLVVAVFLYLMSVND